MKRSSSEHDDSQPTETGQYRSAPSRRAVLSETASRRTVLSMSSAALVAALAGCTGDDDNGFATADDLDPDSPPEEPDSITVRAWGGVWQGSLEEHVGATFTEETGIDVEYDNTDRTVMQGDIRTAIEQDRETPVNVMWTVEPSLHEEFLMELSEPLHPDIITNVGQMFDRAVPSVDQEMLPYVVLYSYTYALSYNEEAMERAHGTTEPPASWTGFLESDFEGEFGQYSNGYGFWPVLSELTDTPLNAEDLQPIYDQLEEFVPSIGHIGDDTSLTQNIREGEVAGGPLLMNNLFEAFQEGEPVNWTIPEEGATVWGDGMYTPKNQSESELYWSQVFIDYAMAAENQEGWTGGLSLPMLNSNVEPLDYMTGDPAFPTSESDFDQLLTVDLSTYTEKKSDMYEEFNIIMGV